METASGRATSATISIGNGPSSTAEPTCPAGHFEAPNPLPTPAFLNLWPGPSPPQIAYPINAFFDDVEDRLHDGEDPFNAGEARAVRCGAPDLHRHRRQSERRIALLQGLRRLPPGNPDLRGVSCVGFGAVRGMQGLFRARIVGEAAALQAFVPRRLHTPVAGSPQLLPSPPTMTTTIAEQGWRRRRPGKIVRRRLLLLDPEAGRSEETVTMMGSRMGGPMTACKVMGMAG